MAIWKRNLWKIKFWPQNIPLKQWWMRCNACTAQQNITIRSSTRVSCALHCTYSFHITCCKRWKQMAKQWNAVQCKALTGRFACFYVLYNVYVQCAVCSVQCTVCSVQCAVCCTQCVVFSVQCSVCSVQCLVDTVQCDQYSVNLHTSVQCIFVDGQFSLCAVCRV